MIAKNERNPQESDKLGDIMAELSDVMEDLAERNGVSMFAVAQAAAAVAFTRMAMNEIEALEEEESEDDEDDDEEEV